MKINNVHYKTIEYNDYKCKFIDQTKLPFDFQIIETDKWQICKDAIIKMQIRGAGAIGAAGAVAMALAANSANPQNYATEIIKAKNSILNTRPTAQNLFDCVEDVYSSALVSPSAANRRAEEILFEIENDAKQIAIFGSELINDNSVIMTHCNAGWLAFVDWGSALAPIYYAAQQGKRVFVYVSETRPRLQGSRLTSFELTHENIPHKIFCDSAAAHLMSKGKIDLLITGADRIAANGDTANKIGTLDKAICANYYGVPFYIAANKSTFDKNTISAEQIPIEVRAEEELLKIDGIWKGNYVENVIISNHSEALNPSFDVTQNKLITGFITEKGVYDAKTFNINAVI